VFSKFFSDCRQLHALAAKIQPDKVVRWCQNGDFFRPVFSASRVQYIKFQRVSRVGFVTAPTSLNGRQPNFARCLAVSLAGTLRIHFRGLLPAEGISQGAKFFLCPSLALSNIDSMTARHSRSGRQPNFAALSIEHHLYSAGRPSRWASTNVLVFTARRNACIASAVLAIAFPSVRLSIRLSVRPSVCLSHGGIVSKRRHVARCSLHCQIAKCV